MRSRHIARSPAARVTLSRPCTRLSWRVSDARAATLYYRRHPRDQNTTSPTYSVFCTCATRIFVKNWQSWAPCARPLARPRALGAMLGVAQFERSSYLLL